MSAKDIERTGAVTVQEALQTRVPGVIIGDIQGNAFQTDVQYRGFTSSPVNGQPQGLAIYQNGGPASMRCGATRSIGSSCPPTPSMI